MGGAARVLPFRGGEVRRAPEFRGLLVHFRLSCRRLGAFAACQRVEGKRPGPSDSESSRLVYASSSGRRIPGKL